MKKTVLLLLIFGLSQLASGQISAKLMKYMDISETQICFVYGGDIWLVSKTGGTASQLTHSLGEESWPRFSPDGQFLAYTAAYNGNQDIYVIPVKGGVPTRVTFQSHYDRMLEWYPDGESILFASARESGRQSYRQFYKVSKKGGFPEKLPIPYGELASFSPQGDKLAYITKITEGYPFKRYRGGLTSDIIVYDFNTGKTERITTDLANDGKPTWVGNKIYFTSDRDENMRLNIWSYDVGTKKLAQVTKFVDFDISFLSSGPSDIVFEVGGNLYKMDLSTENYDVVPVDVVSDLSAEISRTIDVSKRIGNMTASPGGKRIVFEARGELFNVPAKEGFVINMTNSSGAFDMNPAWSPDGKTVAYWSDKSGEYEMYLQPADESSNSKKITNRGMGFGYTLYWSPDSKKIAFIDETNNISILDVSSGETIIAGNTAWNTGHGGRFGFPISWSHDSNWLTFTQGLDNANNAVFVFDVGLKKLMQVTSGFYSDSGPVFSKDGKYLFYTTNRNFRPSYSDMGDGTWVYPNSTQIASISLLPSSPSLLKVKNDEVTLEKEEKKPDESDKKGDKKDKKKAAEAKEEQNAAVSIDFNDIESRIVMLPPDAGNIGSIFSFEGKIVYQRFPNTGVSGGRASLMVYDFEDREEKTVMEGVNSVKPTADGKALLVRSGQNFGVIQPAPGQKIETSIPTSGLSMDLVPREEWNQIFNDTWRRYRDFFYDPTMHQLDWNDLKERYSLQIKDARTRWDITTIQSNLQAELSAGHTYTFGGDTESSPSISTGYLGIDWEIAQNQYRIKRILRPAAWDTEVRSPFDQPGVDVNAGDFIHSVNGMKLDIGKDPYALFEGLNGKTVSLQISKTGNITDAKQMIVKCLTAGEEINLRYLEWMESNRKMIDRLSDGKLGYVYMSNTSGQGQLELVRMYYGQLDKKGFIIDERFNGGGQLADRFLELLQRPVVYNLHWRHGKDHTQPIKTNSGPMGMLINGWAGSGGDGLPWAFQELKAGPIVGERTLGILIGPATGHQLIDGGGVTIPGARLYDNDGHWFWEGEGVAPDIEVWDDPNVLMEGRDPQIERVVQEVLKELERNPKPMTPAPALEDRTAKGLQSKGK